MSAALAPVLDLVIVLVFAATGRRNHGETGALEGVLTTAWPFLVGACVGWAIVLVARRSLLAGKALTGGVVVWLSTIVVGMLLRQLSDQGTAISFVIVSLVFNGFFMLGWRALVAFLERRRAHA